MRDDFTITVLDLGHDPHKSTSIELVTNHVENRTRIYLKVYNPNINGHLLNSVCVESKTENLLKNISELINIHTNKLK